jgi:trehalose/maltose transport system substrate-binding protein
MTAVPFKRVYCGTVSTPKRKFWVRGLGILTGSKYCLMATLLRVLIALIIAATLGACDQSAPEPVSLNYLRLGWIPPYELSETEALSRKFTRETGMGIRHFRGVQGETLDQLALTRKLLQEGGSGPDVLQIDVTWLGVLQGDLTDLRPYFAGESSSMGPGVASSYVVGGKVAAIPYQNHVGVLEYRADLLREYGYDHPPRTWVELERMAARIQTSERAKGNQDFWGYVWPGAAAESLTCNALEWQVAEGGGRIIENDGTISVNNAAAIRAWQRASRWIGWISPPSTVEYREFDATNVFDSGRAAFARVWGAEPSGFSTNREQLRLTHGGGKLPVGKVGYTTLPSGSTASAGTLGGLGLAVSKYSLHPREDAALIRFLLREQIESIEKGDVPNLSTEVVVYDVAPIVDSHDNPEKSGPVKAIVISRPSSIAASSYEQVTRAYFGAVHSVLTGQRHAPESAAELEKDLVKITGFRTGPPAKN